MKAVRLAAVTAALMGALVSNAGAFVTDPNATFTMPTTNKPAYMTNTTDPTFGTTFRRITGDPLTSFTFSQGGSGTWGNDPRHHTPRDQPWNYGEHIIAIQNPSPGTPTKVYLDGDTYLPLKTCANQPGGDDRWDNSGYVPNERLIVTNDGLHLINFDVVTCTQTRDITLPFAVNAIGDGAGNANDTGKYMLLHDATRMFLVNLTTGVIGPTVNIDNCGLTTGCAVGWASVSASSARVVVSYVGDHPRVYNYSSSSLTLTPRAFAVGTPECNPAEGHDPAQGYVYDLGHADMYKNPDGTGDYLVGQRRSWCPDDVPNDKNGNPIGQIVSVSLTTGSVLTLTSPNNSATVHHVSARNSGNHGWVYASFFPSPDENSPKRYGGEVIRVSIDGLETVERYGHAHSLTTGCFRCEVHAVPDRSGTRVMFASNWAYLGNGTPGNPPDGNIQSYILDRLP